MAQYASKRSHPMLVGIIIGMVIGFAVSAATALFITKAPIPFVEKVQHLAKPVDASALDGVDPNQKLYAKDTQGTPVNEPQKPRRKTVKQKKRPQKMQRNTCPALIRSKPVHSVPKRMPNASERIWPSLHWKPMWLKAPMPALRCTE